MYSKWTIQPPSIIIDIFMLMFQALTLMSNKSKTSCIVKPEKAFHKKVEKSIKYFECYRAGS